MRSLIMTVFAIALTTQTAWAWGPNGHRITAQIGQDNLQPEAAARLEQIAGGQSLALMATWPDFVRSFPAYDCFKPWHFLTVEDGQSIEAARKVRPTTSGACDMDRFNALNMPANVVDAIVYFAEILDGDAQKASDFSAMLSANGADPYNGSIEQTALALLVHLVGDVHQPLHVGRGPDRGGNAITVEWFGDLVKLHEVWDELLIEQEQLSFSEYSAFLEQRFADSNLGAFESGPVSWAQESVDHRAQVYNFGADGAANLARLSYQYAAQNDALVKQRLYAGGVRLAFTLSGILMN